MTKQARMRIRTWRSRVVLAPVAGLALAGSMLTPAAGSGSHGPTGAADVGLPSGSSGDSYEVTLITGDVVRWEDLPDGHATATIEDEDAGSFQTIEAGDDYYVIPSDVAPLVGSVLDRELFNVASLVGQGYHDDAVDGVPVILTGDTGSPLGTRDTAPGLTIEQTLPSIDGVAGHIDRDNADAFGNALTEAATTQSGSTNIASLGRVEKIWLDQQVEVALEDSVAQTGAPEAWSAGFDGTGTTIAVLDTGIDESHADIGDQVVATKNFSDSDTTSDRQGHGTHVAATAAGSGDASNGLRTGVAPGAELVNAKVLNDEGTGSTSGIIAGMEWAAEQDVDVINMSLGGGPTDGTDPLSQAVNTLTEEHDVPFVIAAGNTGPAEQSVSAPSTADAALTVGAVDKESQLAAFSSRGPRVGDFAIKPDITAPGMSIVAARAEGSDMGFPVDEDYTSANGTSMAAPHVAGGVAILTQQHPDWDVETLKSALVNSADPHESWSVYEQGGGEMNIAQAMETSVVATPGTLNLGHHLYPHDDSDPATRSLTYTNHGSAVETFDVAITMVDEEGRPAADGMVTVDTSTVTLEPGESTDVEVTVDVTLGHLSLYSGSVVATDDSGDRIASTPAGFYKEGEAYDITVEGIQRNGQPAARGSGMDVLNVIDRSAFFETSIDFVNGVATARVPAGTYSVMGVVPTLDASDELLDQTMFGEPELEISEDTHLVWDARVANEITVDTPYETTIEGHAFHYHRQGADGLPYTKSWTSNEDWPYYAAPTTQPVTLGTFSFATKYEMSAPDAWLDLAFAEDDAIPEDLAYRVTEETMATIDTSYHSDLSDHEYSRTHSGWQPYQTVAQNYVRTVEVPGERTEHVTGGDTARWKQTVYAEPPLDGEITEPMTYYEAGAQLEQSWFAGPHIPSLNTGNQDFDGALPSRRGDLLNLFWIYEWGDAHSGSQPHFGERERLSDSTAFRLYQDGDLVAETQRAVGEYEVAAGESRMRMEMDVAREADWWTTSTQTHTAWEFDSATTSGAMPLPLLQINYDIGLDLRNSAPHPRDVRGPFIIGLDVHNPRGDGPPIEGAHAWLSYDDGATWIARPLRSTGEGSFEFIADRRGGGDHASIRIEAWDADGNTVEQEITRAYTLRDR